MKICCKRCDANNCEGCNLMILSDMLNKGQLNILMDENHTINPNKISNKHNVNFKILGATLLSVEEAKKLPEHLRKYSSWYWLRSPGELNHCAVAYVNRSGLVERTGFNVDYACVCVRPALQIKNIEYSNLQIGDHFTFGGKEFEIVSSSLAFCTSDIGWHTFRENWKAEDANVYEASDIKKFVDKWLKNNVLASCNISNFI